MQYLFPLTAIHIGGTTVVIDTVEGFKAFGRRREIGVRHRVATTVYNHVTMRRERREIVHDWIVRDDRGRVILATTFDPAPSANWKKQCRNRRGEFDHRSGPVPGLRHHWKRRSQAARKAHGGRGVAARNGQLLARDPWMEVE